MREFEIFYKYSEVKTLKTKNILRQMIKNSSIK